MKKRRRSPLLGDHGACLARARAALVELNARHASGRQLGDRSCRCLSQRQDGDDGLDDGVHDDGAGNPLAEVAHARAEVADGPGRRVEADHGDVLEIVRHVVYSRRDDVDADHLSSFFEMDLESWSQAELLFQ